MRITKNNNSKQKGYMSEKRKPSTLTIIFTTAMLFSILLTSCSMMGGFSRKQASEAIMQDGKYKKVSAISTDLGWIGNAGAGAVQISDDDTVEAAAIRAKKDFQKRQPQIIVAEHLGYLVLHFDNGHLGPRSLNMPSEYYRKGYGIWQFKPRAEITEKGKALWKEINLPEDAKSLPTAIRNEPEITGIVDEDKTTKKVEFTTTWKPTELGAAFDPNNKEFTELPPDLQEDLKRTPKSLMLFAKNKTADFSAKQKGTVYFRKYDDGSWRMYNLFIY